MEKLPGTVTEEVPCLHRTPAGRIVHYLEIDRLVVDFKGIYLVLRTHEFLRIQRRLASLLDCPLPRTNLEKGEEITLRDATGDRTLLLSLSDIRELYDLFSAGSRCLEQRDKGRGVRYLTGKAPYWAVNRR